VKVQRLCRLAEIPDQEAKGFTIEGAEGRLEILVYRTGAAVHGYINSCPHVGSPLVLWFRSSPHAAAGPPSELRNQERH
jgi:nitrite reductase/ring-hydroxylating ferredoxin subunit